MYSASPFVPAVLFTTEAGTVNATITENVTGLTITPATANVEQGGQLALVTNLAGTLTAAPAGTEISKTLSVAPDSVLYDIAMEDDDTALDPADYDVYIDRFGILHVGTTAPVGATITATATSTYQSDDPETAAGTYTVVAPAAD